MSLLFEIALVYRQKTSSNNVNLFSMICLFVPWNNLISNCVAMQET